MIFFKYPIHAHVANITFSVVLDIAAMQTVAVILAIKLHFQFP